MGVPEKWRSGPRVNGHGRSRTGVRGLIAHCPVTLRALGVIGNLGRIGSFSAEPKPSDKPGVSRDATALCQPDVNSGSVENSLRSGG
jgi:hypothetical protein